jgi:hypothetical protein
VDPADGEAPEVGRGVEVGHDGLQRGVGVVVGRGDAVEDGLEQRLEVGALHALLGGGPAGPGVGVEDREVDLVLVGVEVEEELLDLVDDLVDAGVGPVDLVDHQDTGSRASRALRSTKRVWGSGPSEASTSRSTPSTMVSPARPRRRSRRGRGCR